MSQLIDRNWLVAVVGATINKEKYGYRVLIRLGELGYRVVGVNPKYEEIEGVKCFPSLGALLDSSSLTQDDKILANDDPASSRLRGAGNLLVITVVPPEATVQVVVECGRLGIKRIWMQVGSESGKAVEIAGELGVEVLGTNCIIVDGLGVRWG